MTAAAESLIVLVREQDELFYDRVVAAASAVGLAVHRIERADDVQLQIPEGNHRALMSIGGDGTYLSGARLASTRNIPVIGINTGHLGFLAEVDASMLTSAIDDIANDRYTTETRPILKAVVTDIDGNIMWQAKCVNDIVIKTVGISLANCLLWIDGELCADFDADGAIISTPTGSTAYALSAGGPLVLPHVPCMLFVPLAPHALVSRPLIVHEGARIEVTVKSAGAIVAADAQQQYPFPHGATVSVSKAGTFRVIRLHRAPSYLSRLHDSMLFGAPLRIRSRQQLPTLDGDVEETYHAPS